MASTHPNLLLSIDGNERLVKNEPGKTLLMALREDLGLVQIKNGCHGEGSCGACTVLMDGKPRRACLTSLDKCAGKKIVTLSGVHEADRAAVAACFCAAGAVQCGYCLPGIAMSALALLEKNAHPKEWDIRQALRPHLCRCTGYVKMVEAVKWLAQARRGEIPLPEVGKEGRVGKNLKRYEGEKMVLGERLFAGDMTRPGMRYGAFCLSPSARFRVHKIKTAPAEALPGVVKVLTWRDVPGERVVGLIRRDWPCFVAEGEETRYTGDVLALVVAETEKQARDGAAAIQVEGEALTPVDSAEAALADGAPPLHPEGNLLSTAVIRRGEALAALKNSAHLVEDVFDTPCIEHAFLETEACLAEPVEEGVRVYTQGQGIFEDRRQIAAILNLPEEKVLTELVPTGGGFGGKEDLLIQGQTALAAFLCGQPVRVTLTRQESLRMHPKRHPMTMQFRLGCDDGGKLTALYARILGDTGAYASVGAKVLERAASHATGAYAIPAVDIEAKAAYTNNPPCGAMRGFGVNQTAFALESLLNRLAQKTGLNAYEIRHRNILRPGDRLASGQAMTKPFGLERCLELLKPEFEKAPYAGLACAIKNVGIGNGMEDWGKAAITVEGPEKLVIRTGFTEMGQGLFTIAIQVACEETGLPPDIFTVCTDSRMELGCGETTASRGTVLAGNALRVAANKLKAELEKSPLENLTGQTFTGEYVCRDTNALSADTPEPKTHLTYGFGAQLALLNEAGQLVKIIAAHDVGRALNPLALEGQIEGAVHMGLGYAFTEALRLEGGIVQNRGLGDLGILRAHQMPEVEVRLVEVEDPETPYGARGVGEIGLVPTAPAVAAALESFDGKVRTRLPMLEDKGCLPRE